MQAQPEAPSHETAGNAKAGTEHPPAVDIESILAQLREGDWVDLYSKRCWHRAQLIWASSKGTLFMFVSHGGRPHSMTKRICERLIGDRYLRPVRPTASWRRHSARSTRKRPRPEATGAKVLILTS